MTPERWQSIKELLDRALDLAEEEVPAFLDRSCDQDPSLRLDVARLLKGRRRMEGFLENPSWTLRLVASREPLPASVDENLAGTRLGPYELRETLGRGGMGSVYLAARVDEEYENRVAIKILKKGLDTDEVISRFRAERQILAGLSHPNIAQLYDGATTPDGRPYLVMELIEGITIDRYCDENALSIHRRVELFCQVCDAVDHAHRSFVVHRDLKPGNILVTQTGVPKLLDFGIAKLIEPGTDSNWTQLSGIRILTPAYASPEQLRGEAVTAASDTYSLGVLLYELLVGRRPFSISATNPDKALSILERQDPVIPSVAVARDSFRPQLEQPASTSVDVSMQRSTKLKLLRRQLRGDLDSIVLKALGQNPSHRYATAAELQTDLYAYLHGRPVSAQRPTFTYRIEKFLRRHKRYLVAVAATLLVIASLLYGALQKSRAQREIQRTYEEQLRAGLEARKAEELEDFLIDFLSGSDPDKEEWRNASLRTVLDRGAQLIPQQLNTLPEVQSALMSTIGRVYQNVGLHQQAQPLLVSSLEKRRELFGSEHEQVAYSEIHLGRLYTDLRKLEKAEKLTRQGLESLKALGESQEPWVVRAENNLAAILRLRGDLPQAEELLRDTLERKQLLHGRAHPSVALGLQNLAAVVGEQGRLQEAEKLYRAALSSRREAEETASIGYARTLSNLGALRQERGDYAEAVELLRESIKIRKNIFKTADRGLSIALNNLGVAQHLSGDLEAAQQSFGEAKKILEESHAEETLLFAILLRNRAHLMNRLRNFDTAKAEADLAIELIRRVAPGSWRLADAQSVLGESLLGEGRFPEAETLLIEAEKTLRGVSRSHRRQYEEALERVRMLGK